MQIEIDILALEQYLTMGSPDLVMFLYQPTNQPTNQPGIVIVHLLKDSSESDANLIEGGRKVSKVQVSALGLQNTSVRCWRDTEPGFSIFDACSSTRFV